MAPQVQSKSSNATIATAHRLLREPWTSTTNEKLQAIECLSAFSNPESIQTLHQCFEMIPAGTPLPQLLQSPRPLCGKVSARAAQALAQFDNPRAFEMLTECIYSINCDPLLRESAVYGLGGCVKLQAVHALLHALNDPEPFVRQCAVRSVEKTYRRFAGQGFPPVDRLPESLAAFALNTSLHDAQGSDDGLPEACAVLKHSMNDAALDYLIEVLLTTRDHNQTLIAIEILREYPAALGKLALAHCLYERGASPLLYEKLSEALRGCTIPEVRQEMITICNDNALLHRIRRFISARYRESAVARHRAARRVLE